jgi:hypothetical protein
MKKGVPLEAGRFFGFKGVQVRLSRIYEKAH